MDKNDFLCSVTEKSFLYKVFLYKIRRREYNNVKKKDFFTWKMLLQKKENINKTSIFEYD